MTCSYLYKYQSSMYIFLLCSGKTVSRFIPIGKILKPLLVECVTPITCYWSLSLFLRGEEQLTLVFKVILQYIVREKNFCRQLWETIKSYQLLNLGILLLAIVIEFNILFVQELRPPLKMLVPIWKALCAAIGTDHQSETIAEEENAVSS